MCSLSYRDYRRGKGQKRGPSPNYPNSQPKGKPLETLLSGSQCPNQFFGTESLRRVPSTDIYFSLKKLLISLCW